MTTAATSLVIAHLAAGTTTIRVGAGGIMLPNHAPYVIAEQFGTLATLFPGRIDLGLGRAPGTDQKTLAALRRVPADAEHFPQDVLELQAFLAPVAAGQAIEAVPGSGTEVPLYILGSSLFGAQLAAELGLPFGFASHFSPQQLDAALAIYRGRFKPSTTADRAARHGRRQRHRRGNRRRGAAARHLAADVFHGHPARRPKHSCSRRSTTSTPYWLPHEKRPRPADARRAASSAASRRCGRVLERLLERTRADELIVVSDVYDFAARRRSFELIAEACASIDGVPGDQAGIAPEGRGRR